MSALRVIDAAMGGICLLHAIASLMADGFPAGGISFFAAVCAFRLAATPTPDMEKVKP